VLLTVSPSSSLLSALSSVQSPDMLTACTSTSISTSFAGVQESLFSEAPSTDCNHLLPLLCGFRMSRRSHETRQSRSRSRDRDRGDNKDFSKMNKHERREEMKKESSSNQTWGNIAKEEEEQREKDKQKGPVVEKEKANFGLSGALAKDEVTGNMYNGTS
jgi:hypothetical protein